MKGSKLLLAFWLSTASFCLLQIAFGPGGMTETVRLREQQVRLADRLDALKAENLRLTARYEALRTSAEAVRLEARSLGWFVRGEVPVRTLGGGEFRLPPEEPDLSTVPRLADQDPDLTWFFRLVWPLLLATFWALLHLVGRLWPPRENRTLPMALPPSLAALRAARSSVLQTGLDFFRK